MKDNNGDGQMDDVKEVSLIKTLFSFKSPTFCSDEIPDAIALLSMSIKQYKAVTSVIHLAT